MFLPSLLSVPLSMASPFVVFLERRSLDDANDPSIQYLKMLEESFVWEARSLWFVAVGVPVYFLYEPAWEIFALLTGLAVAAMVRPRLSSHLSLVVKSKIKMRT
jgi:hypothetical protein